MEGKSRWMGEECIKYKSVSLRPSFNTNETLSSGHVTNSVSMTTTQHHAEVLYCCDRHRIRHMTYLIGSHDLLDRVTLCPNFTSSASNSQQVQVAFIYQITVLRLKGSYIVNILTACQDFPLKDIADIHHYNPDTRHSSPIPLITFNVFDANRLTYTAD